MCLARDENEKCSHDPDEVAYFVCENTVAEGQKDVYSISTPLKKQKEPSAIYLELIPQHGAIGI